MKASGRKEAALIRHYLTVTIRNLLRHKLYTFANVFGLAIGLTCSILLVVYLRSELSYDRHHVKGDRIYRVIRQTSLTDSKKIYGPETHGPLARAMREEIPEIEHAVHLLTRSFQFRVGDKVTRALGCLGVPGTREIFTAVIEEGDPESLVEPNTAFITRNLADRLFPNANPIGQTIQVTHKWFDTDFRITGILKNRDPSQKSIWNLDFQFLTESPPVVEDQTSTLFQIYRQWRRGATFRPLFTYALLREGADPDLVEKKMNGLMRKHLGEEIAGHDAYYLQPLHDIYLRSKADYGIDRMNYGDIETVWTMSMTTILILVIGCANFVNLSTATATGRAREVGMRKASGARRGQLMFQFLGEAILTALFAVTIALTAAELLMAPLREHLRLWEMPTSLDPPLILSAIGIAAITGLLAGFYPALVLASFHPTRALKGRRQAGRGDRLRKALVIFQVAISVFLVVGTTVVERQATFLTDKDLGFVKDNILMLDIFQESERLAATYKEVKSAFLQHPNILAATACTNPPGFENRVNRQTFFPSGRREDGVEMAYIEIDEDFLDTFGIELLAGRTFRGLDAPDDNAYILSETAVKRFGWGEPLGLLLDEPTLGRFAGPVIGVVSDFHNAALMDPIGPVVLLVKRPPGKQVTKLMLKIRPDNVQETIAFVTKKWKELLPGKPPRFGFLDMAIDVRYRQYLQLARIYGAASLLGIVIACMGLLGVVSFTTHQRVKEIGLRKVLGATDSSILKMVYRDPLKLALIGVLVVSPVAWWSMSRWLNDFPYRISVGITPFLVGALVAIVMGAISVGLEGLRATRLEPVDALRED